MRSGCADWQFKLIHLKYDRGTPEPKNDESELRFEFIRASEPGGQNVNKVATSVQLRFDVRNSPSLEAEVKEHLIRLAGADPEGAGKTQGAKSDLPKRYGKGSPAGRKKGAR